MVAKTAGSYLLRCLVIAFVLPGCHIIAAFKSTPVGNDYECTTWVMNCKKEARKPSPAVSLPVPTGTCYSVQTGFVQWRWVKPFRPSQSRGLVYPNVKYCHSLRRH